jgi:hypothetical protein
MQRIIKLYTFGHYQRILTLIFGIILIFSFISRLYAQNATFRAGASTANITPALGSGIVGNFGIPPPANFVHDELQKY